MCSCCNDWLPGMINSPASSAPLLITGFEPFSIYPVNPSLMAAEAAGAMFPDRVIARRLPVDYLPARMTLLAAIADVRPSACLCMGQAPSDEFRLEQIARKPVQFAEFDGPAQLAGTWPWEQMERTLRRLGVPHRRSIDAGRYVCESTYWALLDAAEREGFAGPLGFLHVPAISPAWPAERTTEVVAAVVGDFLAAMASQ